MSTIGYYSVGTLKTLFSLRADTLDAELMAESVEELCGSSTSDRLPTSGWSAAVS